jgi:hypothetical protein
MSASAAAASAAPADRYKLPGRGGGAVATSRLLELQPELLEAIASKLTLVNLSALAVTCLSATPMHAVVIGKRISALRELTGTTQPQLNTLIERLPNCPVRVEITAIIESSMQTFRSVCTCNEDFLRLSRAVAMRGLAAPFSSPVDAARLARTCCATCDDVTRALLAVSSWLTELTEVVGRGGRRGELALLEVGDHQQLGMAAGATSDGAVDGEGDDDSGDDDVDGDDGDDDEGDEKALMSA